MNITSEQTFETAIVEHLIEFKLSKAIAEDPELNKKKAARAIGRYVSLHPHNLAQKTEIIIEHFRQIIAKKEEDNAMNANIETKRPQYTRKQGQYLAFIYYYSKIHGIPPAHAEIQRYFRVTPPTVHQMILRLEQLGFLQRIPNQARSLRLLLPREELPDLE